MYMRNVCYELVHEIAKNKCYRPFSGALVVEETFYGHKSHVYKSVSISLSWSHIFSRVRSI